MNILVASGSFKDVYSPIEACETICSALDGSRNTISYVPFCDGGEYTYDVLKSRFRYEEVRLEGIWNAYGKAVSSGYLVHHYPDGTKEAHIVSSCILRLYPEEDQYKNPLVLTDYGFGQLIADALNKGCRKLVLYFGGTSTAACGLGALQALGGKLFDSENRLIPVPCTGADLIRVSRIAPPEEFTEIPVHIIADGDSKVDALPGITGLKVGKTFSAEKDQIVAESMQGVRNIVNLSGISPDYHFTGAAGGLLFGLEQIFHRIQYTLGGLYFKDVLEIEKQIEKSDLIITGEGRYDNTADGKAPSVIAGLAKKYGRPCILVCGQIDRKFKDRCNNGMIDCSRCQEFGNQGITAVLTCQEYYDRIVMPDTYQGMIQLFREQTPIQLKNLLRKAGL